MESEKARLRSGYEGHVLQPMFLMAHYTIEPLRETWLRSFYRYRVDYNGNEVLEWEERWALVALIKDWTNNGDGVYQRNINNSSGGTDRFLDRHKDVLDRTGYREPDQAPAARYEYSGMEGFLFFDPSG